MAQNVAVPVHEWYILRRNIAAFAVWAAEQEEHPGAFMQAVKKREYQIAYLPQNDWRGKKVYQITCHGTRGKGPHKVWVPESLLWSLIDFRMYRCVFHAGD